MTQVCWHFWSGTLQYSKVQSGDSIAVTRRPSFSPKWLEPYIDVDLWAARLTTLSDSGEVPETDSVAVSQCLKELALLKQGKNPDAIGAMDDLD